MAREPRALRAYSLMVRAVFHHATLWDRAGKAAVDGRYDAISKRLSQVTALIVRCAKEC